MGRVTTMFSSLSEIPFSSAWQMTQKIVVVAVGAIIFALGFSLFQVPFNIAAGGVSGLSIVVNHLTGWSEGVLNFLMNIPLLILGFFSLGRWKFLITTLSAVLSFSVATDLFTLMLPDLLSPYPITSDVLLSTIYGGLVTGVGMGLIYRAGSSPGGTSVLSQILLKKTGMPLSQLYLYTDGIIILLAGYFFGWEIALHAMLALFLSGIASDFVIDGPSQVRTVTIVTDHPEPLSHALIVGLRRSVSYWQITGGYTGKTRAMIMCTVLRSQVRELKQIVADVDPLSFVVVGNAHQALGGGFMPMKSLTKKHGHHHPAHHTHPAGAASDSSTPLPPEVAGERAQKFEAGKLT
jgi:uncharacterized membrane-anchored protein YitT (DUF2179 family)